MISQHDLDIAADVFPSLKKYMRGPFAMRIYNHGGESLAKSLLCFDIEPLVETPLKKSEAGIILEDTQDLAVRSLAVIPFVDVFKAQIIQEAEKAEKLILKSQNAFRHAAETKERATVRMLMDAFYAHVKDEQQNDQNHLIGKEAVSDTLATSLSASTAFYDCLWDQMMLAYDGCIRNLGEECALGQLHIGDDCHNDVSIVFE